MPSPDRAGAPPYRIQLTREEALCRLASSRIGRVVFTSKAMPAIHPGAHLLDSGHIIVPSQQDSVLTAAITVGVNGTVVAYQADNIDPGTGTGWSVTATGLALVVTEPARVSRYRSALPHWAKGQRTYIIAIAPEIVTGFELAG